MKEPVTGARPPRWLRLSALVLAGCALVTFIVLGNWQLRRLDWKLNLMDAVETRAFQAPVTLPPEPITAEEHAYLRVALSGSYRHQHSQRVKALTELGGGSWLLTPLESERGYVWINRGFVPSGTDVSDWTQPQGVQQITGLLRMSEPGGTLLEDNQPELDRWVSRDIEALQAASGLYGPDQFFIDADHQGESGSWTRGGMTRLRFRNNHLSYALTWYAMALGLAAALIMVARLQRRSG